MIKCTPLYNMLIIPQHDPEIKFSNKYKNNQINS